MSKQVEAARQAAETTRAELRAEFAQQFDGITNRIQSHQQANEAYQRALQAALEERLAEFANHQHVRLLELDNKIAAIPASLQADVVAHVAGATRDMRNAFETQAASVSTRLDELQRTNRRFDEQASALVQHVNDSTAALSRRMDEGDQSLALAVEERLAAVAAALDQITADTHRQIVEHGAAITQRVDATDVKITDRMLAMEERINEQSGTKIAGLEAAIGRIGNGFDDAMGALSQRILEAENRVAESTERVDSLVEQVGRVDERTINELKEQVSSAVGEAMLVRIEVDRSVQATEEKVARHALRMSEIEAQLADTMDVSTAVQLERLDELERQVAELDPERFAPNEHWSPTKYDRRAVPRDSDADTHNPYDQSSADHSGGDNSTEQSLTSH